MKELHERVPVVLPRIWNELPTFFGDAWLKTQARIWELLRQLEAGNFEATEEIVEIIATVPAAYERLKIASDSVIEKTAYPTGAISMNRYVQIPVMYGTDRKRIADDYSGDANEGYLALGEAKVSIPEDHSMGEMEHPPKWKCGFGWNPKEHISLLSVKELENEVFVTSVREMIEEGSENEALVFIHGYSVNFKDAARRAAQLAYDLRFKGVVMLYSWPSKGKLTLKGYIADGDLSSNTRPRLRKFLTDVMTDIGIEGIHIIAHSMGNRPLTETLKDLALSPPVDGVPLKQVVFAAPDVSTSSFKELASKFQNIASRFTLYANSDDKALKISRKVNSTTRAGDSRGLLISTNGVDTIDVTGIDTSFVGHSVYSDNRSVLADLELLIREQLPPENRPLLDAFGSPSKRYWKFRR